MKLLFDQNISYKISKRLPPFFEKSKHISNVQLLNATDIEIWEYAKSENYTIVTFDADFSDFGLLYGCPPKIIWIRKGNLTTHKIIELLEEKHLLIRDFITNPEKDKLACLELH